MACLDIFACPLTGEPLTMDRDGGALLGARQRYPVRDQVERLNPVLEDMALRDDHEAVNRKKPAVSGECFDGPFDRLEALARTLRLDRLLLSCQMHVLEKPA